MPRIIRSLYLVPLLFTTVQCQGGNLDDPLKRICLFDNHQTVVVGSTLYVDGGEWAGDMFFAENNTAWSVMKYQSAYK